MTARAHAVSFAFFVSSIVAACGGGSKPAESGGAKANAESTTTAPSVAEAPSAKPKREFRYPAPFMEPSCTDPQPEGAFEGGKKAIQDVKQKNWDRLQRCIQDVPEDADIHGTVNVAFRLDPDGVPRCVEATGGTEVDEDVVRCVLATYRTFTYPKPRGGSKHVTDSIRFETSEEE